MDYLNEYYFTEESRLKSFTSWPYGDDKKCNKNTMAEAGFLKTGDKDDVDLAKCFLCGKQMEGWEEQDDPWEEHKSHASYCLFAQIGKPECNLKLEELVRLMIELKKNIVKKNVEGKVTLLNEAVKEFEFRVKVIR